MTPVGRGVCLLGLLWGVLWFGVWYTARRMR